MAQMGNPPQHNHLPVTPPADSYSPRKGLFPGPGPSLPHSQPVTIPQHPPSPPQTKPGQPFAPQYGHRFQTRQSSPQGPPPGHQARSQTSQMPLPFSSIPGPPPHLYDRAGNPIDPRYVAMASRISAYYQQRCQAIAAYQQQRCQEWAALQRQKCQNMMQAALLVVAWYVRDRISRRRRRQKQRFRRGLSRKTAGARPTKGEAVRRWVLDVPDDVLSAADAGRQDLADGEEDGSALDRGETGDKDTDLYRVADDLIRSQVGKIDVPLMGLLSFEESESEIESASGSEEDYDQQLEGEEEEMEFEEEEDDEDEKLDGSEDAKEQCRIGSQEVQANSGDSRERSRSCCDT